MRWYEWTNRGFFDGEGRLVRIQAIGRDVTERRRAEEALLESEQRLRLANKATNDVVWDLDIVNDSERWIATGDDRLRLDRRHRDPVPESWWSERVHPDDSARVHESYQVVIDDPAATSWVEEYRFRRADGSYAEVLDRGHVLRDSAGTARRMIGAMLDISERRRAEQELQESRDLMELIIQHDPNAIAVLDDELRYIFVSDRFLDDYGVAADAT